MPGEEGLSEYEAIDEEFRRLKKRGGGKGKEWGGKGMEGDSDGGGGS